MMMTDERLELLAPCGIDCGICELYICRDNTELYDALIARGIPMNKIPCDGCRNVKGQCPVLGPKCETWMCIVEKGIDFCYECDDFPCNRLQPAADRADVLPHNLKVFNLCSIANLGAEEFVNRSLEIKRKYYTGKMHVGKGPQLG